MRDRRGAEQVGQPLRRLKKHISKADLVHARGVSLPTVNRWIDQGILPRPTKIVDSLGHWPLICNRACERFGHQAFANDTLGRLTSWLRDVYGPDVDVFGLPLSEVAEAIYFFRKATSATYKSASASAWPKVVSHQMIAMTQLSKTGNFSSTKPFGSI
jgi:hypothetical protein